MQLHLSIKIDGIDVQHSRTHENEGPGLVRCLMVLNKYLHTKAQLQVYMKAIPKIDVIVEIRPISGVNSGLVMQSKKKI